jgi:hypothetical protein
VDEAGIRLIIMFLPPLIKMQEWHLLFSIQLDGRSMRTFYSLVAEREDTVIFIQDEEGGIFGSYTAAAWHQGASFYGSGESCFVFNYVRTELAKKAATDPPKFLTENINVFDPSYVNHRYQHSDLKSITLGASEDGSSAIYIGDEFRKGYTSANDTFTNPQLTKHKDFSIVKLEVWGFDEL